ncbi:MAG: ComF family protein [Thiomicrorhabdus sp.]|nr:ComF family protein [Thiomicrorhabdus sp.]
MNLFEKWLLPPTCVITKAPAEEFDLSRALLNALSKPNEVCPVCCELSLNVGGEKNLCGVCLTKPPAFCRTQVGFYFEGVLSQLVYGLKYHQKSEYARLLVDMTVDAFDVAGVQALVPVPLHPLRRRDRGYNQAELIAKELGKLLDIPVLTKGVRRIKDTPSQTHLNAKQRQQNLRRSFEVTREAFDSYSHIALVDDVITTGATMQVLAKCFQRKTNTRQIEAWAIAKTE